MKNLTLENIALAVKGTYHGPEDSRKFEILSVTTDSRKAEAGCLFVPIVGERADGHSFIPQVIAAGAACVLSERELENPSFPWIQVASTLQAVKDLAAFYLDQLNIPVVGVTGSVGKTSTKEMIASVLSQKYATLKTLGNFNNELGLPLTVFRLREEEIAVLEMGINHFGEMSRLAAVAKPDTAVITNIGTCHLEFLQDRDGVLKAKTELLPFIRPQGHIVFNGNDDKLCTVSGYGDIPAQYYGLPEEKKASFLSVWADQIEDKGFGGTDALIHLEKSREVFPVHIPVPGRHMVMNALAAAAVGEIYGLSPAQIQAGIENVKALEGRFHLIQTDRFRIVDDCYNASPLSMKGSLDILRTGAGRRVAILGDMGELGKDEVSLHREVGAYAAQSGIDTVVFVGKLAMEMAEAARQTKEDGKPLVYWEPSVEALTEKLASYVQDDDTILVKASHFMHFERVLEALRQAGRRYI
ncbi:MAG: UDP-N-acetylmuramoyl-tripeptide--D-alanyl-D-alanine ligase [Blautia sp.]|nr:UDP-N-acetylmuramoyl-tripeptide--D-alanyl-D-alanine ligase [Blautia sp.]